MQIDRRGREYAHWDFSEAPNEGQFEVTFNGSTWHPMSRSEGTVSVLVAGPDAMGNPDGTAVLALGSNYALLRCTSSPETLVRGAGEVYVRSLPPAV